MQKRGKITIFGVILTLLVLISFAHTAVHFSLFGTGIQGLGEKGISGLVIGEEKTQQIQSSLNSKYPNIAKPSRIALIIEWIVLIIAIVASLAIEKMHPKDITPAITKPVTKGKSETDLDGLYSLLKEKKKLKLSAIAKIFKVSEETATDWAKILESGNLAAINYPRIGEAELVLV
jgi:hypothetical protein